MLIIFSPATSQTRKILNQLLSRYNRPYKKNNSRVVRQIDENFHFTSQEFNSVQDMTTKMINDRKINTSTDGGYYYCQGKYLGE